MKRTDSGVVWLGDIPRHWTLNYLGNLVDVVGGSTPSKENLDYWNGSIPWVSPKDMKREVISDSEDHVSDLALRNSSLRLIPDPAVLMVIRGMILDHTVPIARTSRPVTVNQDMKALRPRAGLSAEYLSHFLRAMNDALLARVEEAGHGTKALRTDLWRKLPVLVPPEPEQNAIVSFLNRKTATIDSLIAGKARAIELLHEQRQALIIQAVTKGLDPDVRMKDSGTEWIGSIPAHWNVARVKHVAKLESGHTPSRAVPEHWLDSNDIPWVSLNDTRTLAKNDYISDTVHHINKLGLQNSSAHILPAQSVVFTRDATIGKAAIITRPMAVSQHIIAWVCGSRVDPGYLLRVLYGMEKFLDRFTFGATIKTIGMSDVGKLVTPLPPRDEQRTIVAFVSSAVGKLDGLADRLEAQIAALIEYRQALITAAVTGKIDLTAEAA